MKTIIIALLVVALFGWGAGCGKKRPPKVNKQPTAQHETTGDAEQMPVERTDGTITVHGLISHADGTPANNYTVRVFKKGIRSEEQLGSASTDPNGAYSIRYVSDHASNTIVVKVYLQAVPVATSDTIYNVSENTLINITIPASPSAGATQTGTNANIGTVVEMIYEQIR